MCGACYEFFPRIEDFNTHECPAANQENNVGERQGEEQPQESCTVVQDGGKEGTL